MTKAHATTGRVLALYCLTKATEFSYKSIPQYGVLLLLILFLSPRNSTSKEIGRFSLDCSLQIAKTLSECINLTSRESSNHASLACQAGAVHQCLCLRPSMRSTSLLQRGMKSRKQVVERPIPHRVCISAPDAGRGWLVRTPDPAQRCSSNPCSGVPGVF